MSNEQVVVNVSACGVVAIDAQGFQGNSCDGATEHLELVLGGSGAKKRDNKPEYHMPAGSTVGTRLTF